MRDRLTLTVLVFEEIRGNVKKYICRTCHKGLKSIGRCTMWQTSDNDDGIELDLYPVKIISFYITSLSLLSVGYFQVLVMCLWLRLCATILGTRLFFYFTDIFFGGISASWHPNDPIPYPTYCLLGYTDGLAFLLKISNSAKSAVFEIHVLCICVRGGLSNSTFTYNTKNNSLKISLA